MKKTIFIITAITAVLLFLSPGRPVQADEKKLPFLYVEVPQRSLNLGETITAKARLVDSQDLTPLADRKITFSLNAEESFRKVGYTNQNGWTEVSFSLKPHLDESTCCMKGKRNKLAPYLIRIAFTGDQEYARQQVNPIVGIRHQSYTGTTINCQEPNDLADRLVKKNLKLSNIKARAGETTSTYVESVCAENVCFPFKWNNDHPPDPLTLDVSQLPRGSYTARIIFPGDPQQKLAASYLNYSFFVKSDSRPAVNRLRGLYWGWDNKNARPEQQKNSRGEPLSFDGLVMFAWNTFLQQAQAFVDEIIDTPIKTPLPNGGERYKQYIFGITPVDLEDYPQQFSLPGYDWPTISYTCEGKTKQLPDIAHSQWQQAFKDQLTAVAQKWHDDSDFRKVTVGVRIGGGYHGEWGNELGKNIDCINDAVAEYYKNKGQNFEYEWGKVQRELVEHTARVSQQYQIIENGQKKRLHFILERQPVTLGRRLDAAVGFKFNAVDPLGLEIYDSRGSANINYAIAQYAKFFPWHFGGLETLRGFSGGAWVKHNPDSAKWAINYWNTLVVLESEVDFFDFHGNLWDAYINIPGLDRFVQSHISRNCDEVGDGFLAFRQVADAYKITSVDPAKTAALSPGNIDLCLYAPEVEGVRLKPIKNQDLPGGVANAMQAPLSKAAGQYYVSGGHGQIKHTRQLESEHAYLDVDEGITSRAKPNDRWKIKIVYLDDKQANNSFSVDYCNQQGQPTQLATIEKTGTEKFIEKSFYVTDFGGNNCFKNVSADIRLNKEDEKPDIFNSFHIINLSLTQDFFADGEQPLKRSDLNGDAVVDEVDYGIIITNFGESGQAGEVLGDINQDGQVDEVDYAILIIDFGG